MKITVSPRCQQPEPDLRRRTDSARTLIGSRKSLAERGRYEKNHHPAKLNPAELNTAELNPAELNTAELNTAELNTVWRNVFPQPTVPLGVLGGDVHVTFIGGRPRERGAEDLFHGGPGGALGAHRNDLTQ